MEKKRISKAGFARMMGTSCSPLDRLPDPTSASVTLLALKNAASALGRELEVELA